MLTAIARFLRLLGPPSGGRDARARDRTEPTTTTPSRDIAFGTGDARTGREERVEPAMEGILTDTLQRTPPAAASPGLPPVDPVEVGVRLHAAARPTNREEGLVPPRESAPLPGAPTTPSTVPDPARPAEFLVGAEAETRQDDAPKLDANPSASRCDPSMDQRDMMASKGSDEGSAFGFDDGAGADDEPFLPFTLGADKHSGFVFGKAMGSVPSRIEEACEADFEEPAVLSPPSPTPLVDSGSGDRLAGARTPAEPGRRVPPRVAARPRTEEWADDELMTLPEAAALFWPAGPITTNTLRTAERDGTLTVTKVAGKFFTTPMAIRRMGSEEAAQAAKPKVDQAGAASVEALLQMKLAEAKRLGGGRARSKRAAGRPVVPAIGDRAGR